MSYSRAVERSLLELTHVYSRELFTFQNLGYLRNSVDLDPNRFSGSGFTIYLMMVYSDPGRPTSYVIYNLRVKTKSKRSFSIK